MPVPTMASGEIPPEPHMRKKKKKKKTKKVEDEGTDDE